MLKGLQCILQHPHVPLLHPSNQTAGAETTNISCRDSNRSAKTQHLCIVTAGPTHSCCAIPTPIQHLSQGVLETPCQNHWQWVVRDAGYTALASLEGPFELLVEQALLHTCAACDTMTVQTSVTCLQ